MSAQAKLEQLRWRLGLKAADELDVAEAETLLEVADWDVDFLVTALGMSPRPPWISAVLTAKDPGRVAEV
jgi:hypothetical protein